MPVDLLDFMGLFMDNHKMSNQTPLGSRYSWIFSLGNFPPPPIKQYLTLLWHLGRPSDSLGLSSIFLLTR